MTPSKVLLKFGVCLIAGLFAAHSAQAIDSTRTVALSGQHAPGLPADVNFKNFAGPMYGPALRIDDSGHVAFRAILAQGFGGVVSSNDTGLWSDTSGSLTLLAREGSAAPNAGPDVRFDDFYDQFFYLLKSQSGPSAFHAPLFQGLGGVNSVNNYGIWSDRPGPLTLIAREGSLAPTPDGANFSFFYPMVLNAAGRVAFSGFLQNGTGATTAANNSGIWSEGSGSLALVVRKGDTAPGTADNAPYDGRFNAPVINASGNVAFYAYLNTAVSNDAGIWSDVGGPLKLLARTGLQAPGIAIGGIYRYMSAVTIADNGYHAFGAQLDQNAGGGVTLDNRDGFWSEFKSKFGGTAFVLMARSGSQAVDLPPGVKYSLPQSWVSDSVNHVAFQSYLQLAPGLVDGTNNQGIWSNSTNQIKLIARTGDQAPGSPSGAVFSNFNSLGMNGPGRLAFAANLLGNITPGVNDAGIWAQDSSGSLYRIVARGDVVKVGPGDFRTIANFSAFPGSNNGQGRDFNDIDQLAFWAVFTDGSDGIFVTVGPDADNDGVNDALDGCPSDSVKAAPGQCGCLQPDTDSDGDGTANCNDGCPNDLAKLVPGVCGCGVAETDKTVNGIADCDPTSSLKTQLRTLKSQLKSVRPASTSGKKKKLKTSIRKVKTTLSLIAGIINDSSALILLSKQGASLASLNKKLQGSVKRAIKVNSPKFAANKKAAGKAIGAALAVLA